MVLGVGLLWERAQAPPLLRVHAAHPRRCQVRNLVPPGHLRVWNGKGGGGIRRSGVEQEGLVWNVKGRCGLRRAGVD